MSRYIDAEELLAWYDDFRKREREVLLENYHKERKDEARIKISILDKMYFKVQELKDKTVDDELLEKIVNMFRPCDRDFLEFKKEDVIVGPNDRAIIGWDNYFPKKWLVEDYGFTEEEASAFIDMVNEKENEDAKIH